MSRSELHSLVRNLRQYLEWQAAPLAATVPANESDRAKVEAAIRERQRAALAQTLEAPRKQAPTPASKPVPPPSFSPTREAQRKPDPPKQPAAPALWKDETIGSGPRRTFAEAKPETLDDIRKDMGDCKRCGLCAERKNIVFGVGTPKARVMFVGEGPGFNEDVAGEPLVGAARELLDKMITAMTLGSEQVYITNIVKCRTPNNRAPEFDEVAKCLPFLERQVRAIKPDAIVTLGEFPSNLLSGNEGSLARIRGQWKTWNDVPVMPTFNPAHLLRKPQDKGHAWDDLKKVMERLDLHIPEKYR